MAPVKLRGVFANKPSFRAVSFSDGLNIILAERGESSSEHDSRNGVGKSSLIEIIHFCLGSSLRNKGVIAHLKGSDWWFGVELQVGDVTFQARRSFETPNQIIVSSDFDQLGLREELLGEAETAIPLKQWKEVLGLLFFDLGENVSKHKNAPTFRALISYFARSGRDAYLDPFTTSRQMRTWHKQVYNAYLVGLNWQLATAWEELRVKDQTAKAVGKSSASRNRQSLVSLENERVRLAAERERLRSQVADFRVVPEYAAVEIEARELTAEMHVLANESAITSQMIEKYEQQMATESSGDIERVEQIYSEAGLLFPDSVSRQLRDVVSFHEQVTRHRKEYLSNEIARLRSRVEDIQIRLHELDAIKAEKLSILNNGGAVEELGALQLRLGRTIERIDEIDKQLLNLEIVTADEAIIASERQALLGRAVVDRAERRPRWSAVIGGFVNATEYLYGEPGSLNFGVGENGFVFDTAMPRSGSDGVENMVVFSYDMALLQFWANRPRRPGFVIHDSLLYEGVDERQVALALQYAKTISEESDSQYIAFLNSDIMPENDLQEIGLDWQSCVKLELQDSSPEGALLGYRF